MRHSAKHGAAEVACEQLRTRRRFPRAIGWWAWSSQFGQSAGRPSSCSACCWKFSTRHLRHYPCPRRGAARSQEIFRFMSAAPACIGSGRHVEDLGSPRRAPPPRVLHRGQQPFGVRGFEHPDPLQPRSRPLLFVIGLGAICRRAAPDPAPCPDRIGLTQSGPGPTSVTHASGKNGSEKIFAVKDPDFAQCSWCVGTIFSPQ